LIGDFILADRRLLFTLSSDKAVATLKNECVRDARLSIRAAMPTMKREDSPELFDLLLSNQVINVATPLQMPAGFLNIHNRLHADNIVSRVVVPILYANQVIGIFWISW